MIILQSCVQCSVLAALQKRSWNKIASPTMSRSDLLSAPALIPRWKADLAHGALGPREGRKNSALALPESEPMRYGQAVWLHGQTQFDIETFKHLRTRRDGRLGSDKAKQHTNTQMK